MFWPQRPISTPIIDIDLIHYPASVGQFAIQLAHLSGYKVATVASPHNYALVKSLGADVVYDVRAYIFTLPGYVFTIHIFAFPPLSPHQYRLVQIPGRS